MRRYFVFLGVVIFSLYMFFTVSVCIGSSDPRGLWRLYVGSSLSGLKDRNGEFAVTMAEEAVNIARDRNMLDFVAAAEVNLGAVRRVVGGRGDSGGGDPDNLLELDKIDRNVLQLLVSVYEERGWPDVDLFLKFYDAGFEVSGQGGFLNIDFHILKSMDIRGREIRRAIAGLLKRGAFDLAFSELDRVISFINIARISRPSEADLRLKEMDGLIEFFVVSLAGVSIATDSYFEGLDVLSGVDDLCRKNEMSVSLLKVSFARGLLSYVKDNGTEGVEGIEDILKKSVEYSDLVPRGGNVDMFLDVRIFLDRGNFSPREFFGFMLGDVARVERDILKGIKGEKPALYRAIEFGRKRGERSGRVFDDLRFGRFIK